MVATPATTRPTVDGIRQQRRPMDRFHASDSGDGPFLAISSSNNSNSNSNNGVGNGNGQVRDNHRVPDPTQPPAHPTRRGSVCAVSFDGFADAFDRSTVDAAGRADDNRSDGAAGDNLDSLSDSCTPDDTVDTVTERLHVDFTVGLNASAGSGIRHRPRSRSFGSVKPSGVGDNDADTQRTVSTDSSAATPHVRVDNAPGCSSSSNKDAVSLSRSSVSTPHSDGTRSTVARKNGRLSHRIQHSLDVFDSRWVQDSPASNDKQPLFPKPIRRNSFDGSVIGRSQRIVVVNQDNGSSNNNNTRSGVVGDDILSRKSENDAFRTSSHSDPASVKLHERRTTVDFESVPFPHHDEVRKGSHDDHSIDNTREMDGFLQQANQGTLLNHHETTVNLPFLPPTHHHKAYLNDAASTILYDEDEDANTFVSDGGQTSYVANGTKTDKHGLPTSDIKLLTKNRIRALLVDMYEDCRKMNERINSHTSTCPTCPNFMSVERKEECWNVFYDKYYKPGFIWIRASGNPIHQEGLVKMFTNDVTGVQFTLVSVDSIRILAGGLAAVVDYTADQVFNYKGKHNEDRTVISCVMEIVHGQIQIVHEHRSPGRPIPKTTRWD